MTDRKTRTSVKKSIRRHGKRIRKTPDVFFTPEANDALVRAATKRNALACGVSETAIVRSIITALTLRRAWCWRVNSGATVVGEGAARRLIKLAPPGTPDILGVLPDGSGRMFGLEVKTQRGKQTAAQIDWQKRAETAGVKYRVVRSVAEAWGAVKEWSCDT